ncbi:MAG TPA: hypothetical protein VM260_17340 [Pirellula sp.]|nr:hypothetical protein [Pirellula sp.]
MVCLSSGALSVCYSKLQDRLSHTIGIGDGDAYIALLESIEGSEEQPWPESPPMQQMVEEGFTPGTSPVLLGVGMSGNGHWSTAIESLHDEQLKFDIACKNSKSSTFLGSQYRVLTHFRPSLRLNAIELLLDPKKLPANFVVTRIEFDVLIGQLELSNAERRICVSPCSVSSSIQTHRWCYAISFCTAG